jgi:hypothetical protein
VLEVAQQLSYYLSVVDGGASSKLVQWGQQLASVGMIAMSVKASVDQVLAPIQNVANAWSGREQQLNTIARTLRQYEYVGQSVADINREIASSMPGATEAERAAQFTRVYAGQFQQARTEARGILSDMNQLAARLPGETEDYMRFFSQSLPFLSQAHGMTESRAIHLAGYLGAGSVSSGIDSEQGARDLVQFLTNGPHVTDRSWMESWRNLATYKGKQVTAEQIRGMDTDKRVEVLENIARALQPQIDATGDSYEALIGTMKSFRHELYLSVTEPIFESWKKFLKASGESLAHLQPILVKVGEFFSQKVAGGLDYFTTRLQNVGDLVLGTWAHKLVDAINLIWGTASRFGHFAGGALGGLASRAYGGVTGYMDAHQLGIGNVLATVLPTIVGEALWVALGPVGGILGGLLARMILHGNIGPIFASLTHLVETVLPPLLKLGGYLYRVYDAFMNVAEMVVGTLLPPLINLGSNILGSVISVFDVLLQSVLIPIMAVAPIAIVLIQMFALGLQMILEFTNIWVSGIAALFGGMQGEGLDLVDAIRQITDGLRNFSVSLQEDLLYLKHAFHLISDEEYAAGMANIRVASQEPTWLTQLRQAMDNIRQQGGNLGRSGHGQRTPTPHAVQDFRYSRFDITQKFAEGFDPDRVASAFTSDLEAMASQRLASGFQPAFTVPG